MVLMRWSALGLVALVAHQARALMNNCPQCYAHKVEQNGGDHVQAYAEMEFGALPGCGIDGKSTCTSKGTMFMEQLDGITRMYGLFYNIEAVPPTSGITLAHAAHIHANPPTATGGCSGDTLGAIWDNNNPNDMKHHMSPYDAGRQLGDLGQFNVTMAGSVQTSQFMLFNDAVQLSGSTSVEGKSINIHFDPEGDDYGQYVANPATDPKQKQMEGMSKATGMHNAWQNVPASGSTAALTNPNAGWANSIGCGEIKKLGTPTVKATAHMSIDRNPSTSGIQ